MRYVIIQFLFLVILSSELPAQDSITVLSSPEHLSSHRFFFKGETHEFREENAKSLFALLKYLYANNNVRYLIMECGPDQAFLANKYLTTADDSLLTGSKLYPSNWFWQRLNVFNISLPADQKIKVLGFDFNRYIYTAKAIKYILKDKPGFTDDGLNAAFTKVIQWDTVAWDMNKQKSFATELAKLNAIAVNDPEVRKIMGDNYPDFIEIINNQSSATPNVKRDKQAIARLLEKLPSLSKGNFLFNYGIAHVFSDGVGAAAILSANKDFAGQVCSIYPFYILTGKAKSRAMSSIDKNLPEGFRNELKNYPDNTLISLEEKGIYPRDFSKAQWLLVIKEGK